ncbi:hypothetical protein QYF36_018373 [Acer negundo]|nr:hypothetical protein QYF36_018373 [Acer negundo]
MKQKFHQVVEGMDSFKMEIKDQFSKFFIHKATGPPQQEGSSMGNGKCILGSCPFGSVLNRNSNSTKDEEAINDSALEYYEA